MDFIEILKEKITHSKDSIIAAIKKRYVASDDPDSDSLARRAYDYLLLLPNLVILVSKVTLDNRVPRQIRLFAGAMMAYVLSPIDIIPELITGPAGFIDDLFIIALGLNIIIKHVDPSILDEHWKGRDALLDTISEVTSFTEKLLPHKVIEKLHNWIDKKGGELMVIETKEE